MASTAVVPLDEYLQNIDNTRCEYVDGILIDKPVPTWMHAALQAWISVLIMRGWPQYIAGGEVHSRLRETEFRLPDVAVQLRDIAQKEGYAKQPPLLCVEILSPEDRLGATFAKCERYHDWGVPTSWIVDPVKRRAWSYERAGEPIPATETLDAGDIHLLLADVFSIFDAPAGQP
jgi:Uma2 family endonuclease